MALTHHTAPTLERLSELLARELRARPGDDPMRGEQVIVGSPGLARWLRPRLAQLLGVCAHIEFPLPGKALAGLFEGAEAWSPEALTWSILGLLGELDEPVASYLGDEGEVTGESGPVVSWRRLAFAREVADILDRVNLWRPEWVEGGAPWPDEAGWLADLHARLVSRLGPPQVLAPHDPPTAPARPARFFVFGATSVPPSWQRALDALGAERPGHVFALAHDGPTTARLQAHACHGAARQTWVLRDALLHLFHEDPSLQPRDVLVLTPDLETYAPLVASVFSRRQPLALPFHVVGRSLAQVNPVADAMLRMLDLAVGRVSASEVLGLLALWPVHRKAGIAAEELPDVGEMVGRVGVRWGIDAGHRSARFGQPQDDGNTWEFGLRRLALGVAMADDPHLFCGTRPLDEAEGAAAELAGRVVAFCRRLLHHVAALGAPPHRTAAEWGAALRDVVDELTAAGGRTQWLRGQVLDALTALEGADFDGELDLRAIRGWLAGTFDVPVRLSKEDPAALTVASFGPLRGVPYRVVCMLGMDEDAFPRRGLTTGFDPVLSTPRSGDPVPAEQDRAAFRDALRAASDHLVVTWAGRDPFTNQRRAPCVPVAELLDARGVEPLEHPLQPFDPRAFDPSGLPSWDAEAHRMGRAALTPPWERVAPDLFGGALVGGAAPADPADPDAAVRPDPGLGDSAVIRLDDLIAFFDNPAKHLIRSRLQVWMGDPEGEIADREPESLSGLDAWGLKDELLRQDALGAIDLHDAPRIAALARGGGLLPLAGAGDRVIEGLRVGLLATQAAWEGAGGRDAESVRVDTPLAGATLQGAVPGLVGDVLVVQEVRSFSPPGRQLGLWIRLLAAAQRGARTARRFSPGKDGAFDEHKLALAVDQDPKALLADLVRVYLAGHRRRLPLFQHASREFAGTKTGNGLWQHARWEDFTGAEVPALSAAARKAYDAGLKRAVTAWEPNPRFPWGHDSDCPYTVRLWSKACPFRRVVAGESRVDPEFVALSLRVWGPFLHAMRSAS